MLRLKNSRLSTEAKKHLASKQSLIDAKQGFQDRVDLARTLWARRKDTIAGRTSFFEVRATLGKMAGELQRCMYCEDSAGDEIEHHRPKRFYPEQTFRWQNHLFACGPCNGPKNSKFAVIDGTPPVFFEASTVLEDGLKISLASPPALINPRRENPLDFLSLDIEDTFEFVPNQAKGTLGYSRAIYTIDVLRLNLRDALIKARANAYRGYRARLIEYIAECAGGDRSTLLKIKRDLLDTPHPTVWLEMQRQHSSITTLQNLFAQVPEALNWRR